MSKISNNIKSRYFIINLQFKELKNIYNFKDFNTLIIDWIEVSLLKNYNSSLNWNIGIHYPDEFYLTNDIGSSLNKEYLYENLIIKIFIYLDNTYYPNTDTSLLYYSNYTNLLYDELHPQEILENFNLDNCLMKYNKQCIINKISISGVDFCVFYNLLNSVLIGDLFSQKRLDDIKFIYLKNVKLNNKYKLIQPIDKINHFVSNFLYNSNNESS
jgi:hypothetical protein